MKKFQLKLKILFSKQFYNTISSQAFHVSKNKEVIHHIQIKMYSNFLVFMVALTYAQKNILTTEIPQYTTLSTKFQTPIINLTSTTEATKIGCTCGIFLSGQFKKGSKEPPKGNPALLNEYSDNFACNNHGNKLCSNKCLDIIVKHLPNSANILCGSIDRDCIRERAYLFIKNCIDEWVNTNLSTGREYCCKDGLPYKCASK